MQPLRRLKVLSNDTRSITNHGYLAARLAALVGSPRSIKLGHKSALV